MGWGTTFTAEIYLNKKIYRSKEELIENIEQLKDYISTNKEKLLQYASCNIKDIIPEDYKNDPLYWINIEVTNIINDTVESTRELQLLALFLEEYDNQSKKIDD